MCVHMGGCQALNNRCRIIIGTQKGTIILTTTHMNKEAHTATYYHAERESTFLASLGFGLQVLQWVHDKS